MSDPKTEIEEIKAVNDRISKLEARTQTLQWALILYVVVCSLLVLVFDL